MLRKIMRKISEFPVELELFYARGRVVDICGFSLERLLSSVR